MLLGAPLDVLIDREHGLPPWYDPGPQLEATQAWEALQQAANEAGLKIDNLSGYRTYEQQTQAYTREVSKLGEKADLTIAMPGHSEHQLGTVFDVVWPGVIMGAHDIRNDQLYRWLNQNAHHFGFVLSYPYKVSEEWPYSNRLMPVVTDYIHEPWHIRYVGVELARSLFAAGYLEPDNPVLPQDFYRIWP